MAGYDTYEGPERRAEPRDEAFERAVQEAAAIAAQQVSRIHRIRLVTQASTATFVVACVVALIVGLSFRDAAVQQAKEFRNAALQQAKDESSANCALVQSLSATMSDFISSDASVRFKQAAANVTTHIGLQLHLSEGDIAGLQRVNKLGTLAATHWTTVDLPRLTKLAAVNCDTGLP